MADRLVELAEAAGFSPASRAGVDERRFSFATRTHQVFVSARHELLRGVLRDAYLKEFQADLGAAREWCEAADDDRILRVDRMELRPLTVFDDEEQVGDELVILSPPEGRALHPVDEWPTLDENPEVGG